MERPDYEPVMDYLRRVISEKEAALENATGKMIKIEHKRNSTQYFVRENSKDKNGTYLPANQILTAYDIVQENYDKEVLRRAKEELEYLEKFQKRYPTRLVEDVYTTLSPERQAMVNPVELPDEDYVKQFLSLEYEPLPFRDDDRTEYYLRDGTRVRSKSEVLIGDELLIQEVPRHYEPPLRLANGRTVRPDFYVLNVRTRKTFYWEHFGMLDRSDYLNNSLRKLQAYQDSGIYVGEQLIITCETRERPLSTETIRKVIRKYLK